MKKKLIVGAVALVAAGGFCFGQSQLSITAGNPKIALPAQPTPSPPVTSSARGGVIPTAFRHGNPLQMLNPAAPARYGNAQEHVTHDPADPGKPKGIKLFEWTF
jgi:hypothetical protein